MMFSSSMETHPVFVVFWNKGKWIKKIMSEIF
jgi:hypothetical protein